MIETCAMSFRNTILTLSLFIAAGAEAAQTKITVRAVSRDAKVIGDGVGGARITIRELSTGKVLAAGIQKGGTGDTKLIMQSPRSREASVYATPGAASFDATLELAAPTRVEIVAEGPLKFPQAMQRVSTTMLLVPGRHVVGEGVVLEIAGLIVDAPESFTTIAGEALAITAKVTMTCGCPTEPGGLWDANEIEVKARVRRNGSVVREAPLAYAGTTSTYSAELEPLSAGDYEIEILAANERRSNFGRTIARALVHATTAKE